MNIKSALAADSWLGQRMAEGRRRLKRRLLDLCWPLVLFSLRNTVGRRPEVPESIAIVTVNYNSNEQLNVLLSAVAKFTARPVRLIVVDNRSAHPPLATRSSHPLSMIRLPFNILHGPALDLGVMMSRTEYVVTLDVDAFPVAPEWLDSVIGPLRDGARLAGGSFPQAQLVYAHPCFLALRRRDFVDSRSSFREVRRSGRLLLDVGAALTVGAQGEVVRIDPTEVRGPGFLGTTYGGVVYHNFYGTRLKDSTNEQLRDLEEQAAAAWAEAVEKYLSPITQTEPPSEPGERG